jgi:2-C-methyl-D-erythritol 4-phosphate cytidylyltransferase
MLTAIIVAAGSSRRLGFDKLTRPIAGRAMVLHTVAAFENCDSVDEILVVTRQDRLQEFSEALSSVSKLSGIVPGGEHRHNSVQAGLARVNERSQYVAVHDAARPLITPGKIEQVFEQARIHGAAALAEPMRDTLKRATDQLVVCESIDRHQVFTMQTPQIFERALLEQAYAAVSKNGWLVTDEVSAVELLGRKVVLVSNTDVNLKITYEQDLQVAEAILQQRSRIS